MNKFFRQIVRNTHLLTTQGNFVGVVGNILAMRQYPSSVVMALYLIPKIAFYVILSLQTRTLRTRIARLNPKI